MTQHSANYLTITTVCAILLAGAGISQASPDLGERANANAKSEAGPATNPSSSWPPRITKSADTATASSETSKSRREPVRKAALEPATETATDQTATDTKADATATETKTETKTETTDFRSERQDYRSERRHSKRATYDDRDDDFTPRFKGFRSDLRRTFRSPLRIGHLRFGRRWF